MIHSIEMINWRIFEHETFEFEPGITFLMGLNGRGKTSILEAICYALTGKPTTVKDRTKLLRDVDGVATVRLVFSIDGQQYRIERSQSSRRAESAQLSRLDSGRSEEVLATSHTRVTTKVEQLLGISAAFLERIVYMSEGDVFRFLSSPPRQALDLQVRQVLGLTQLDEFTRAIKDATKDIRTQAGELQTVLDEYDTLAAGRERDLEAWQKRVTAERQDRLAELRVIEDRISRHKQEHETLRRLEPLVEKAVPLVRDEAQSWPADKPMSLVQLYSYLEQQAKELEETYRQTEEMLHRGRSEDVASHEILNLVAPLMEHEETAPCPVCRKPFTAAERADVLRDIQDSLKRLAQERDALRVRLAQIEERRHLFQTKVEALRPLVNVLEHSAASAISESDDITHIQTTIARQKSEFQLELARLESSAELLEEEIEELEDANAEVVATHSRLHSIGYDSPAVARDGLISLETRLLSLRSAEQAAQQVLTAHRNMDMDNIYDQVAQVWRAFAGRGNWQVELDHEGVPILRDADNRQFDLSQFSGGEKTALLVILHTIIAQHFSETDFLLVDEPLEHLDPVNRRSLVQFLINAYRRGRFRQAIVATFEESLIRKYMSDDDVKIIHLQ